LFEEKTSENILSEKIVIEQLCIG